MSSIDDTPLRIQLVVIAVLLVALALFIVGITARSALRGYLLQRVDNQLVATARDQVHHQDDDGDTFPAHVPGAPGGREPFGPALQTAFFGMTVDTSGNGTGNLQLPAGISEHPPKLPVLDSERVATLAGKPFTTSADGYGPDWRVAVLPFSDHSGATVAATSLSDVERTLGRLEQVELYVSVTVLLILGILGYVLVRSRLHRLEEVESVAERIAAGDMTQRVPNAGGRSEVGRLAEAFNSMLGKIESAFAAQRSSEEEARASESRMRRFVGDASHELRTPLTSIRGFAELHRQRVAAGDPPPSEAVTRIESEATRMGTLVDDLLLLARLDQQRPLEQLPVNMHEVVCDVVKDAPALAPRHHVSLNVHEDVSVKPIMVTGDVARLRQVISNLLMNAYTHTPPGTHVGVRLGTDEDKAIIEVSDDGPGMTETDAARVFERFYRSDPSRTRLSGGSGLGLSIVAGIVKAHAGDVDVRTVPDEGATFSVRLPLLESDVEEPSDS